jgi:hypothetical protein
MDEPLVSGTTSCHLTLDETAVRTAAYAKALLESKSLSDVEAKPIFGDIEAYPAYTVEQLEQWIGALQTNGLRLGFFHLDIDMNNVNRRPRLDMVADLRELKTFLARAQVPFGVILWSGYNPENTDKEYYEHVLSFAHRLLLAIGKPEQSIFQSWVFRVSKSCSRSARCDENNPRCSSSDPVYCGMHSIPINLPESNPQIFSHTRLINELVPLLVGP